MARVPQGSCMGPVLFTMSLVVSIYLSASPLVNTYMPMTSSLILNVN